MADGSVKIKIDGDSSEFEKELDKVTESAEGAGEKLSDIGNNARAGSDGLKDLGNAAKEASDKAQSAGDGFGAMDVMLGNLATEGIKLAGEAIVKFIDLITGADEATEGYRMAMGKLNTAFESAGMSNDAAVQSYKAFFEILGDTDTAAEASQLLASLAKSEQDISVWTKAAAGVYGTFGDALPIEGLIEAANETSKTATVTGVLADALNWVGISEDKFNERLAACGDETERNNLIMSTLFDTYADAADTFYATNEALIQSRDSQMAVQESYADIGDAVSGLKSTLLYGFAPAIQGTSNIAVKGINAMTSAAEKWFESMQPSDVEASRRAIEDLSESLQNVADDYETTRQNAEDAGTANKQLADKIVELAEAENKSAGDLALLNKYIDEYNEAVPGAAVAYDELTDSLNMSADAMYALIDAQIQEAKTAAYMEEITAYTKTQIELEKQLAEAAAAAEDARNNFQTNANAYKGNAYQGGENYAQGIVDQADANVKAIEALIEQNNANIETAEAEVRKLGEATASAMSETAESVPQVSEAIETMGSTFAEAASASQTSAAGVYEPWETAAQVTVSSLESIGQAIESQKTYWADYSANMDLLTSSGIEGMAELVAAYSDGSAESVNFVASLASAYDGTDESKQKLAELISSLGELETAQQNVGNSAGAAATMAAAELDGSAEAMAAAQATISAYASGIVETAPEATTAAEGVSTSATEALDGSTEATNSGGNTVTAYSEAIAEGAGGAKTAGEGVADSAVEGLATGESDAVTTGENLVEGYIQGVQNKSGALSAAVAQTVTNAIAAGDAAAQIHSPSRRTAESGRFMVEGYIEGLEDKAGDLDDVMERVTEQVLEAFPEDSDGYELAASFMEAYSDAVKDYADDIQDAIDEINDGIEDMTNKLRNYGDIAETTSAGALQDQIAAMQQYANLLEGLKERGASDSLMSEIAGMGIDDATAFAQQLMGLSDDGWAEYLAAWEDKQALAASIAQNYYQDELQAQTDALSNVLTDTLSGLDTSGEGIGSSLVDGIIAGMKSKEQELAEEAQRLGDILESALKESNEIHSPSRRMAREIGAPLAQGLVYGFDSEIGTLGKKMQAAVDAETAFMSAGSAVQSPALSSREVITNNTQTIREKVVRVEGDGNTDELIRLLNLRLKAEDRRVGGALIG